MCMYIKWEQIVLLPLLVCFYTGMNLNLWLIFKKDHSKQQLISSLDYKYRHLDDIWIVNNPKCSYFCKIRILRWIRITLQIYHVKFWIKTLFPYQCSYSIRVYDTKDDFSLPIVNFPFMNGCVPFDTS